MASINVADGRGSNKDFRRLLFYLRLMPEIITPEFEQKSGLLKEMRINQAMTSVFFFKTFEQNQSTLPRFGRARNDRSPTKSTCVSTAPSWTEVLYHKV